MLVFQKLFFRNSIKAKVVGCISISMLAHLKAIWKIRLIHKHIYQIINVHKSCFSTSVLDSKNFIATSDIDSKKFRSSSTVTLSLISPEKYILNQCNTTTDLGSLIWNLTFNIPQCEINFGWIQKVKNWCFKNFDF